jgi:hypothetical protein
MSETITLPCQIGDTVYWKRFGNGGVISGEVVAFVVTRGSIDLKVWVGKNVVKKGLEQVKFSKGEWDEKDL